MKRLVRATLFGLMVAATCLVSIGHAGTRHPVSCFKAHGWEATGDYAKGKARDPHSPFGRSWTVSWWRDPKALGGALNDATIATPREMRVVRLCLGTKA